LLFSFLFYILSERCEAEEDYADVSILGEPTYKLTNKIIKNRKILGKEYQIDIIMFNSGNIRSDEIEINLTDKEGFSLSQRTYFQPEETKTISFNWSTMIMKNQDLRVNFYPSNLKTKWTEYNSGYRIFKIKVVNDSDIPATSTPGFEIFLLISALIGFAFLLKRY
jgi:hypothetical protein